MHVGRRDPSGTKEKASAEMGPILMPDRAKLAIHGKNVKSGRSLGSKGALHGRRDSRRAQNSGNRRGTHFARNIRPAIHAAETHTATSCCLEEGVCRSLVSGMKGVCVFRALPGSVCPEYVQSGGRDHGLDERGGCNAACSDPPEPGSVHHSRGSAAGPRLHLEFVAGSGLTSWPTVSNRPARILVRAQPGPAHFSREAAPASWSVVHSRRIRYRIALRGRHREPG